MKLDFYRKIGYGLRLEDDIPADPIKWAEKQVEKPAPLTWPGHIPSAKELLDHRAVFVYQDRKVIRKKYKDDRKAYKNAKDQLRYQTGERYFKSLETVIRQHAAVKGDAPVFERIWHFWCNHFAISEKDMLAQWNTGAYQREIIRPNICGNFTDLVKKVTTSWTMIHHLDNSQSISPNSKWGKNNRKRGRPATVNENHARELLELHTVSPAAGYTQKDVISLSYIMAGWENPHSKKREECNPVKFNVNKHEPGDHKVLGKRFKQRGLSPKSKLIDCIEYLCAHPETPKFICRKLVRHFVCDEPTDAMVQPLIDAWHETKGDLPTVYKALIKVVYDNTGVEKKFLNPETWLLQCVRIAGLNWPPSPEIMEYDFKSKPRREARQPDFYMRELGHDLLAPSQPNGWPETEAEWMSPELLIRRLSFAANFANDNKIGKFFDYAKAAEKNFDDTENVRKYLKKAKDIDFYSNPKRIGQALFSSEWMLKV